ncbi:MAG: hypothetical protein MUP22_07445 [Desulfobacterales bacterium]|nr:hypothetical protein [Desulfobacterales bacterium]
MGEYFIKANIEKNRLYMTLKGFFNVEEVTDAADKTIEEVKKLQTGFDIINDIREFIPGTEIVMRHIQRAQEFNKERGVKRIVRIVKESDKGAAKITKVQFRKSQEKIEGYEAIEAPSVEEAERMLDEKF